MEKQIIYNKPNLTYHNVTNVFIKRVCVQTHHGCRYFPAINPIYYFVKTWLIFPSCVGLITALQRNLTVNYNAALLFVLFTKLVH